MATQTAKMEGTPEGTPTPAAAESNGKMLPGVPVFGTWQDTFLLRVAQGCSAVEAARIAGQPPHAPYYMQRHSQEFADAWAAARDAGEQCRIDQADHAMWSRHVEGYDKAVTYQGKVTDTHTDFDTTAGKAWLAAHDPRYRSTDRTPPDPVSVTLHLEGHDERNTA